MATISIDYDSQGDIELIMEMKPTIPDGTANFSVTAAQESLTRCEVGPISIHVRECRLRVSSTKLISSSRYFQTMLVDRKFPEGRELQDAGFVPVELLDQEDDPNAMMIILGILYNNDIRTEVDLSTFGKVTILVDKYMFYELLGPHPTMWFEKLRSSAGPQAPPIKDIIILLSIAWQFGLKEHFKALTGIVQQGICASIDPADCSNRLPTRVVGK